MNTKGLSDFVEQNWKVLAGLILAACAVVVLTSVVSNQRKAAEHEATNALFDAQKSVRAFTEKKEIPQADQVLEKVADTYKGTRAAYEAELQAGDLYMDAGSYAEAAKRYDQASSGAKDPFSKILARYNLGIAKESAGQYQEAVTSYDEALNVQGSDFLRAEILMAQARCFEALKQIPKALAIYKDVQKNFATNAYYSGAAATFAGQLAESKQ